MTTMTDPPKGAFRLSMLLYDSRYRSMTIQIIVLMAFMLGAAWLINNAVENLAEAGKEISFGFLGEASGYDISQRLIDYSSQSTHARAALVGILNTLLVAVMGCITATIIGVVIGVLRLSNNWIVSRLAGFYVESLRNVPVLLWIVLTLAIIAEFLPVPASFRGEDPESTLKLFESFAITNRGIFIPRMVMTGDALALGLIFIASLFVLRLVRKNADKVQENTGQRPSVLLPSLALLILPVTLAFLGFSAFSTKTQQAFIMAGTEGAGTVAELSEAKGRINYCHANNSAASLNGMRFLNDSGVSIRRKDYFNVAAAERALAAGRCDLLTVAQSNAEEVMQRVTDAAKAGVPVAIFEGGFTEGRTIEIEKPVLTEKGIAKFEGGTHLRNSLIALWLALSLYTAAFIAEIVRAGIMAISKGQSEAAGALGLRPGRTMRLVVLPQAMRVIFPPLISQYLNLTKNSSLAIAVGYMDVTGTLGGITLNQTGREMETILLLMAVYLIISLVISTAMNAYNERTKLKER